MKSWLDKVRAGFASLRVDDKYKQQAFDFLTTWLEDEQFAEYRPQILHLIESGFWDYLLDCFYQVIPFGTGGRRGEVGIGPNRINLWTIRASAQGHSQYLIKHYGEAAKTRGIVMTYDVRQFFTNKYFDDTVENPVKNLKCKDLAVAAAEVYAANGIRVYVFDDVRTTPELSFAIRHVKAVGGDMFSASHNPPEHNGKKVYDETGGQLIPPFDEELVLEVTQNVTEIKQMKYEDAVKLGLVQVVGQEIDEAYVKTAAAVTLSDKRDIKIVYTPLHGCGHTSVLRVLEYLGFKVTVDSRTGNPSGKFENVTFNIPNPEVIESFDSPLITAKELDADILLNSDPDADRIGIMVKHQGQWTYLNGNEIGAILAEYVIAKKHQAVGKKQWVIKTAVTTNLISEICKKNGVNMIGDLLVGFKYIGDVMNQLEKKGEIDDFLFGSEESHGYIAGNYVRDKDAAIAAVWLAELAAELKLQKLTLVDYLKKIYAKYGYFRNYLTEIRLLGAEGKGKISKIQETLRGGSLKKFGRFEEVSLEDFQTRLPIVSETDRESKNVLVFNFKPDPGTISIKVTVRPSGTEPKVKMYFEIGTLPFVEAEFDNIKLKTEELLRELEKEFITKCYKIIDIDFPARGFLVFWQLPADIKMQYFRIEPEIEKLKELEDGAKRMEKLQNMLAFLGSDPIEKVDKAFAAKNGVGIRDYLR
jgi:phosphoglucomutase